MTSYQRDRKLVGWASRYLTSPELLLADSPLGTCVLLTDVRGSGALVALPKDQILPSGPLGLHEYQNRCARIPSHQLFFFFGNPDEVLLARRTRIAQHFRISFAIVRQSEAGFAWHTILGPPALGY